LSETLTTIDVSLVNPDMFSGSTDPLRMHLDQAWEIVDDSSGVSGFLKPGEYALPKYIEDIYINPNQLEILTSSAIGNSFKTSIRVEGSAANITSDTMWRDFILGGEVGYEDSSIDAEEYSFDGIFSSDSKVYRDGYIRYSMPYRNKMAKVLNSKNGTPYIALEVEPRYNYHIPEYYSHTSLGGQLAPEKTLPNIHWYYLAQEAEDNGEKHLIPDFIYKYITLDNQLAVLQDIDSENPISTLLGKTNHQMLPPEESLNFGVDEDGDSSDDYMVDRNYNLRRYLSSSYVKATVSGSTYDNYQGSLSSIIYNASNAESLLSSNSPVLSTRDIFPYYVDILIPSVNNQLACHSANGEVLDEEDNKTFRNIFLNHNFDSYFMNCLTDYFNPAIGVANSTLTDSRTFVRMIDSLSGSEGVDSIESVRQISQKNYKSIDFFKFLTEIKFSSVAPQPDTPVTVSRNDPLPRRVASFMSLMTTDVRAANRMNSSATSQINTMKTLNVLKDSKEVNDTIYYGADTIQSLYEFASNSKYYEILAFRIEKLVNNVVIQNFWIYNSTNLDDINFTDSQVLYGQTYTYNIYQYIITRDLRYKFSEPIYTQQIDASILDDEEQVSYCLQFLNSSGFPTSQYYDPEDESFDLSEVNTFADVTQVIKSKVPYYADAIMEYETGLRLYEVPVGTKNVTIQDHPPSALDIIPFFIKDNSKVAGFQINYDAFAKIKLPQPLDQVGDFYKHHYRDSYDMLQGDKIIYPSRSRLARFEIFRMAKKPEKLTDFGSNPHKIYDMKIRDEKSSFGVLNCYEKVLTNTKYYYIFRAVNELDVAGPLSHVYEIELVDDGGYNYLLTKVYTENELSPTRYINTSKSFKKIIYIQPSATNLTLNTAGIDLDKESSSQLDNLTLGNTNLEDPLWGKTFKIRLKSKKSGKKIDLNITYNLDNG